MLAPAPLPQRRAALSVPKPALQELPMSELLAVPSIGVNIVGIALHLEGLELPAHKALRSLWEPVQDKAVASELRSRCAIGVRRAVITAVMRQISGHIDRLLT